MGAVYAAEQWDTHERVAVKILHSHLVEPGGDGLRRFRREAEAARAITSPHIVRVLDAGTDEATGRLYLVTEHLEGEDLQRLLERVGPLPVEAALRVAEQALEGLVAAHEARVVHRDIKPANVFLARSPDGTLVVKLLDFGIAKVHKDRLEPSVDLTTTGAFLGSPLYMSPEQMQNSRDADHQSDLWSLGCVLYSALAGRAPQQHLATIGQLVIATCTTPAPPLSQVAPWVPAEVAEVVHRALQIQPDARFESATAMLEAVRELLPPGTLTAESLAQSGERAVVPSGAAAPEEAGGAGDPARAPTWKSTPGASGAEVVSPRVVVAGREGNRLRGDEVTEQASRRAAGSDRSRAPGSAMEPGHSTLRSGPEARTAAPIAARSGVPAVGARADVRQITIDPRRFLGEQSELWTFSLDVHTHLPSLIARIWKALRRGGAKVAPMTYGSEWVLFEPRTSRVIADVRDGDDRPSLEAAGIRPGTVLWVLRPDAVPSS